MALYSSSTFYRSRWRWIVTFTSWPFWCLWSRPRYPVSENWNAVYGAARSHVSEHTVLSSVGVWPYIHNTYIHYAYIHIYVPQIQLSVSRQLNVKQVKIKTSHKHEWRNKYNRRDTRVKDTVNTISIGKTDVAWIINVEQTTVTYTDHKNSN
jgi:hypothetical protein